MRTNLAVVVASMGLFLAGFAVSVSAHHAFAAEFDANKPVNFKGAVTKDQWKQQCGGARNPLGKLVSRKVKSRKYAEQLPSAPDGRYVVIEFEASFEHKASAVETVTPMLDSDGVWRVSGYYVR